MLELPRHALTKMVEVTSSDEKKDAELKLVEAHPMLEEVGLKHEDYSEAVEDLATCLKIRETVLLEDSRLISEVLYQLSRAQVPATKCKEAKGSLDRGAGATDRDPGEDGRHQAQ